MRILKTLVLALPALLATKVVHADTLATGDPATLLQLNEDFITGLVQPTSAAFLPDGKVVVTEQGGAVKIFEADGSNLGAAANHVVAGSFEVDLDSEKGLLNVLVHPDFANNRRLIFYYSADGTPVDNRHRVTSVPLGQNNMLDLSQETILVQNLIGPANHNGGALAIAGGMLYIGVGDTGCNKSPINGDGIPQNYNPTCLTNGNGKILRINLDGTMPANNPLVGMMVTSCDGVSPDPTSTAQSRCVPGDAPTAALGEAREDIFAWGFRNPWRIWVDPETNYVWVGDVGEATYEEVNVITAGGKHYGWPFREGNDGDDASVCTGVTVPDPGTCVEPTYFYPRNDGQCIAGGPIITDCRWPDAIRGRYIFGDVVSGNVWSMAVNATRDGLTGQRADFITDLPSGGNTGAVTYVMGADGGLYYVTRGQGQGNGYVARVFPQTPIDCVPDAGTGAGGAATGGSAGAASGGAASGGTTGTSGGASAGGASGGNQGSGGVPTGSGGAPPGSAKAADAGDDGGCGCRVAGGGSGAALGLLALALGSLAFGTRRKRRSSKPAKRN